MSETQNASTSTQSFIYTLIFYGAIGVPLYILFECVKNEKAIYVPRTLSRKLKHPGVPIDRIFKWITVTLSSSDEETRSIVGTDAYVYLRYLRMMANVFTVSGILGLLILFPIYQTASSDESGLQEVGMANIPSQSRLLWAPFIMSYVFVFYFLYCVYTEYKHFVIIRQRYFAEIGSEAPIQSYYTCLLENLPIPLRNDISLKAFFEELFPGEVYSAVVAQNLKKCEKTIKGRAALVNKLEATIAKYESTDDKSKLPMIGLKSDGKPVMFYAGEKVSALSYYKKEIQKLNTILKSQQQEANEFHELLSARENNEFSDPITHSILYNNQHQYMISSHENIQQSDDEMIENNNNNKQQDPLYFESDVFYDTTSFFSYDSLRAHHTRTASEDLREENRKNKQVPILTSNGFVTFTTARATASCWQMPVLSTKYTHIKSVRASAPSDYIWENITVPKQISDYTNLFVNLFLITGLLFWGAVVSFVGVCTNLQTISKFIPAINDLSSSSYALLQSILPITLLTILLLFLPLFLFYLAKLIQMKKTLIAIEIMQCRWAFLYYVVNIYILIISGSTIQIIEKAISDPMGLPALLATAIAKMSNFFIQYFIMKLFLNLPFMISRLVPLLIVNFSLRCSNERKLTIREIFTGPLSHVPLYYGIDVPDMLYVSIIVFTYWVITPLICVIAAIYFSGLYTITKFQLLYVYVPRYQSGGEFFYIMYQFTMIALFISSLGLIGYMGIKQGDLQAILLIPQPFLIIIAWLYTEKRYKAISENTALSTIAHRDRYGTTTNRESRRKQENTEAAVIEGKDIHQNDIRKSLLSIHDQTTESSRGSIVHFKNDFYRQPTLNETNAKILPYRIDNEPLFFANKQLNPTYYDVIDNLSRDLKVDRNSMIAMSVSDIPIHDNFEENHQKKSKEMLGDEILQVAADIEKDTV